MIPHKLSYFVVIFLFVRCCSLTAFIYFKRKKCDETQVGSEGKINSSQIHEQKEAITYYRNGKRKPKRIKYV